MPVTQWAITTFPGWASGPSTAIHTLLAARAELRAETDNNEPRLAVGRDPATLRRVTLRALDDLGIPRLHRFHEFPATPNSDLNDAVRLYQALRTRRVLESPEPGALTNRQVFRALGMILNFPR